MGYWFIATKRSSKFIFIIGLCLIAYLSNLFSFQGSDVNDQKSISYIGIIVTLVVLAPLVLSLFSGPTYHYSGLPRFADELIEAMVPPLPLRMSLQLKKVGMLMTMMVP